MHRFASVVLVIVLAGTATAQESGTLPADVQPGARVRATGPAAGSVVGRLLAVNGDTLQVVRDAGRDTVSIAASRLTSLDLSTGRHKRRWAGAAYGLFGGAVVGAAVGAITYRKQTCAPEVWFCDMGGRGLDVAAGAVLFGAAGTVVGAIVGGGRTDSWRRVLPRESARLRLVVPRAGGRSVLAASLRF